MNVIVPYTRRRDQVHKALGHTGYDVSWRDVSASEHSYFDLLAELWARGESFALVEHDVIVRPDTLRELERCPASWCAFEVPYAGDVWAGLSCVYFAAELIARHPDMLERVAGCSDETHPPRHWCRLDAWLSGALLAAGEERCTHSPALRHLRAYSGSPMPSHACWR